MLTLRPLMLVVALALPMAAPGTLTVRPAQAQSMGPTPSIMVEERGAPRSRATRSHRAKAAPRTPRSGARALPRSTTQAPAVRARGSSTLIPPPVPSPNAGPPDPSNLRPGPGVYQPPKINGYGDRVLNCIQTAPLNMGVGNNPSELGAYTRSCANGL